MSAFDDLYAKYMTPVFRYALKCVGRRDVAEDITSEVFLELYRQSARIDASRLPGWLFGVAKHKAADYWRRVEVEGRHLTLVPPAETSYERPLEAWLEEMQALKPVHRACLILRYVHGMERQEIARRLGLSENQVKSALQYSLTILRRELETTTP
jgi:RNA polymerase sigma-70 factor (ECF subfamily)